MHIQIIWVREAYFEQKFIVYIWKHACASDTDYNRSWNRYMWFITITIISSQFIYNFFAECHSVTDSIGSHSDISGLTIQSNSTMIKPHMDVVCVIDICQSDNLNQRKKALDEVKLACFQIGANLNHIQVFKLKTFIHISFIIYLIIT